MQKYKIIQQQHKTVTKADKCIAWHVCDCNKKTKVMSVYALPHWLNRARTVNIPFLLLLTVRAHGQYNHRINKGCVTGIQLMQLTTDGVLLQVQSGRVLLRSLSHIILHYLSCSLSEQTTIPHILFNNALRKKLSGQTSAGTCRWLHKQNNIHKSAQTYRSPMSNISSATHTSAIITLCNTANTQTQIVRPEKNVNKNHTPFQRRRHLGITMTTIAGSNAGAPCTLQGGQKRKPDYRYGIIAIR